MITAEHAAQSASTPNVGLRVGARLTSALVLCALASLLFLSASALADTAPTVTIEPASAVSYTTAHVSGTVNPNGGPSATAWIFEYSKNPEGEGWTPDGGGEFTGAEAEETTPIAVQTTLEGLQPNTTYQIRLLATNAGGEGVSAEPNPAFVTKEVTKPTLTIAAPSSVTTSTAHFSGTVNPNAPGPEPQDPAFNTTWHFQCTPECPGLSGGEVAADNTAHEVSADASELLPNQTYTVTLVASNLGGQETAGPLTFTATAIKPTVEGEAATNLTKETATLNAKVNPNGDEITSCTFEYGTQAGVYPSKVPCSPAPGAGRSPVPVSAAITGLSAETNTYHWRLIVGNSAGTSTGVDHTFIYSTQSASSSGCPDEAARQQANSTALADCRAYELVTPDQKNGALINVDAFALEPQIAADGHSVIAQTIQCFAGAQSCVANRQFHSSLVEFARTAEGWVTRPLAPPASRFETSSPWAWSADGHDVLFSSPGTSGGLREDFWLQQGGTFTDIGPVTDSALDIPEPDYQLLGTGLPVETTSDLSHVLYLTKTRQWAFDETTPGSGLYEYVGRGGVSPLLVGVTGAEGSRALVSTCGTTYGSFSNGQKDLYGSLSADGRTVYFSANGGVGCFGSGANAGVEVPSRELWARIDGEQPDARSVRISAATAGVCQSAECQSAPPEDAYFEGASSDGSRVVFTSTQQLTDQASEDSHEGDTAGTCTATTEGFSGCNLYESECPNHCEHPAERRLADISQGAKETGGPNVQGVMAISPDGSHVYFVAKGALTAGAQTGAENLYVYDRTEGHLSFITTLPPSDEAEWRHGVVHANVTPGGRFLLFTSHGKLTADNPRAEGPSQVYRYDANSGSLVRISIGNEGFNDNGNEGTQDAAFAHAGFSFQAEASGSRRANPSMSDDGSYVFFQSPVALTAGALNEVPVGEGKVAQNIYEYHEGHVYLISDGKDVTQGSENQQGAVNLIGADTTGANVFFTTNDQLTPQDTNSGYDFYDAHICSGAEPCTQPPARSAPCEGETCQGASSAASPAGVPASSVLSGQGNLTAPALAAVPRVKPKPLTRAQKLARALRACRAKHDKHKRAACEKQARRRYGAKATKAKRGSKQSRSKR